MRSRIPLPCDERARAIWEAGVRHTHSLIESGMIPPTDEPLEFQSWTAVIRELLTYDGATPKALSMWDHLSPSDRQAAYEDTLFSYVNFAQCVDNRVMGEIRDFFDRSPQ
ncbi:MAG: hypothetical protein ABIG71_00245 [Candidatus Uhrbacteria bacterium]